MIILIGLLVLIAAVVVGVAGVAANSGEVRTDTSDFGVLDYHFTASAGELFFYGMAVGAIGMLGLSLLLLGVWRSSRRNSETRRELRRSRKEVAEVKRNAPPTTPAAPTTPVAPAAKTVPVAAEPKKPIPASATATTQPDQKPVWSLNRFLPKTSANQSRPTADAAK